MRNPKNPGSRDFYERVGLNERELEILQVSVPKQHYYVVSPLGRRLVDLRHRQGRSRPGSASTAARSGSLSRASSSSFRMTWRSEWLRLRGLPKWADYLDRMEEVLEQPKEE